MYIFAFFLFIVNYPAHAFKERPVKIFYGKITVILNVGVISCRLNEIRNVNDLFKKIYAFFAGCGNRGAKGLFFQKRIMASEKADLAHANVNNL